MTIAIGGAYARDLANGLELERRLASADAPDAAFIMLDSPDHGGHGLLGGWGGGFYPYSTAYMNTINFCDGIVGRCLDAIAKRPTFKEEDWMVVITSDHGGYANTRGLFGGHATAVPLVVSSRHVRQGRIPGTPRNYDVAPTVLAHFGIDISEIDFDGRAVGGETVEDGGVQSTMGLPSI
jgi:membrane-anchored protein YejM (alkaline phosphatase superfamily)